MSGGVKVPARRAWSSASEPARAPGLAGGTSRKCSSTTRSAAFVVRREWRAISVRRWKTTTSFEQSRT
ncbi:hypothetical protein BG452_16895 [Streptomyces sp. CBMA123]|nr:hypothetical protein [Streptomyces sp. CBMA123]